MRAMAARHFGALKNTLRLLKQCYDEELSNKTPPTPDLEFPYPLSYSCINTSSTRYFTYISHMDRSKLLFTATETGNNEKICIKFARHYSKDVHEFCASKGFAPVLKGFEKLSGGWWMVVMQMIGEDYCRLSDFPPPYSHHKDIAQNVYRGSRLWRPLEAEDGQLIKADHDIEMLNTLFQPRDLNSLELLLE